MKEESYFRQSAGAVLAVPAGEAALREEILRLNKIIDALMNRAERTVGAQGSDFGVFQTAILLEHQVRERTRELEAAGRENERIKLELQQANRDMEAFSYSAAHDLRAPLRAIDGFSQLLERNSGDRLNDAGRENLQRVRERVQHMNQLIDDLLRLSLCGRAELCSQPVELAALAGQVMAKLRQGQDQEVDFAVAGKLSARGDTPLLVILLENLLGNALKYSRQCRPARIEFGYDSAQSAFYVRDNGAGFDMAYADRLFRVFQRLHSAYEFEGTGVGLAIVHRIVQRHGGRVWGEGKVGQGATFYFTLPMAALGQKPAPDQELPSSGG